MPTPIRTLGQTAVEEPTAALGMSCDFDAIEHCAALDRVRLRWRSKDQPWLRIDVVQLRPGRGDRVFSSVAPVRGGSFYGCFACYPDDIVRVAMETGEWGGGAWPLLRPTPGSHEWRRTESLLAECFCRHPLDQLRCGRRMPWSDERSTGWFVRIDYAGRTLRNFFWHDAGDPLPHQWDALRAMCYEIAAISLREPSQAWGGAQ